ncbi:MAG: hypothetical protein ACE15C_17930 [Phycisphaerae bacterium]
MRQVLCAAAIAVVVLVPSQAQETASRAADADRNFRFDLSDVQKELNDAALARNPAVLAGFGRPLCEAMDSTDADLRASVQDLLAKMAAEAQAKQLTAGLGQPMREKLAKFRQAQDRLCQSLLAADSRTRIDAFTDLHPKTPMARRPRSSRRGGTSTRTPRRTKAWRR